MRLIIENVLFLIFLIKLSPPLRGALRPHRNAAVCVWWLRGMYTQKLRSGKVFSWNRHFDRIFCMAGPEGPLVPIGFKISSILLSNWKPHVYRCSHTKDIVTICKYTIQAIFDALSDTGRSETSRKVIKLEVRIFPRSRKKWILRFPSCQFNSEGRDYFVVWIFWRKIHRFSLNRINAKLFAQNYVWCHTGSRFSSK